MSTFDLAAICRHAQYYNGKYYVLVRTKRTFDEAEGKCIEMGGHLASVHASADDAYFKQYIKDHG